MEDILTYFTSILQKKDLTTLKEKIEDFAKRLKGETVVGDKGYIEQGVL